jgi:hypothetical protein
LFGLPVSDVSVLHGRDGIAKQSSSHHGGQEAKREDHRKGPGQDIAPVTYFLQLDALLHHLSIMSTCYESIGN